jgi:pimeloyl-ACP methyl ester carboxylesterase
VSKFVVVDIGPAAHLKGRSAQRIREEITGVPEEFDSFEDVYAHLRKENPRPPEAILRRRVTYQTRVLPNGRIGWRYDVAVREQWRRGVGGGSADLWAEWRKITCPVLIVRGVHTDNLVAELASQMLEGMPNAQLVEIQRAAHMVFEENPDDFLREVRGWLRAGK